MSSDHRPARSGGLDSAVRMSGREIMSLYLLLRGEEDQLDEALLSLLGRIEEMLFSRLSIDEMERIADLYQSGVDVFAEKDDSSRS